MEYNVKTFAAHVTGANNELATVLCVTYSFDQAGQLNAALFGPIVSEFPPLPMPVGRRPLNFREQLRITGSASCHFDAGVARENERAFLSAKLAEAFGPVIKAVEVIPQG